MTTDEIVQLEDVEALGPALAARRFEPEQPSAGKGAGTVVTPPLITPPMDPAWQARVVILVEAALNRLVEEFLVEPYRHRCEHSLHCELYRLLTDSAPLDGTIMVGSVIVRPVQKEWPETSPSMGRIGRGNYDLAVLGPCPGAAGVDTATYRNGRIKPAVVIELGLDYDVRHLQQDRLKLASNGVPSVYLVHLARPQGANQTGVEAEVA
ncbi:MAG: hypothetical protein ABL982_23915, partial [Vicinamibacterales bacterium]